MASQIPVDAKGNYPVNAALVTVLAVGFVVFNQLLGWGLVDFMADQGRAPALTGPAGGRVPVESEDDEEQFEELGNAQRFGRSRRRQFRLG